MNEAQEKLLLKGLEEFNGGHYFDCHETLEALWKGLSGDEKTLVQGIIQVSVAYYHLQRGNTTGALRLFDRALPRIEPYLPTWLELDLAAFFQDIKAERERLAAEGLDKPFVFSPPSLSRLNAPEM